MALSAYVFRLVMIPLVCKYWRQICANFLLAMIVCIVHFKVWWYKGKYKGNVIYVRQPHNGFAKMNYDINPAEVGTNPFGAAFWWHISSALITIEGCIHLFMGNDLQRAAVDGDNSLCLGMMAQEMNHGTAQLFYSRGVERSLGYPEGYRQIWKYLLLQVTPTNLRAAFLMWFEASGIILQLMMYFLPMTFEQIVGEPSWLYTWHFMEEAEHSWDYSHEVRARLPIFDITIMWIVMVPVCLFLWVQAFLQGLWYGLPTFKKHPSRLITAPVFHLTVFLQMLIFMLSYSFLEMVLGMRADKAYEWARDGMARAYEPYKHHFEITHTQAPSDDHITSVKKKGKVPRSSILGVQTARRKLYEAVLKTMKSGGMTEEQIKRTSFAHISKTNTYNPLLN